MRHLALIVPSLLALTACNEGRLRPALDDSASAARLTRFADCGELRDYLTESWTESLTQSSYGYYGSETPMVAEDSGTEGGGGPSDYSETNTQEQGVDEPDMVKTDGEYIYVVQNNELHILKSWPTEDTELLSTLSLPGYTSSQLLDNDRLLVFANDWVEQGWDDAGGYSDITRMLVIDVSDRSDPDIIREISIEGWMYGARMIGSDVYLVTSSWFEVPYSLWELMQSYSPLLPRPGAGASESEVRMVRAQGRRVLRGLVSSQVDALSDNQLVPLMRDGQPGEEPDSVPLMACSDIYRPDTLAQPRMTNVVHLDLSDDDGALGATGLMAGGWTIYANQERLYVAQTSWDWWWGDGEMEVETHVHRFALEGDSAVYEASGAVDGWVLNQFSMSEFDDSFRIATTDQNSWNWEEDTTPASHVFVLQENQGSLDVVGHVGGIAPGETIQSARFLGKKGFLVTYEQVDPLFTLDLADPTNPQLVGELELPGFSTYLHPLDDDTLVSVGFSGTWEGEITGMAVSMFDVSDFANPRLADQYTLAGEDWGSSEALYNHHAFTLHNGVLSLPIYSQSWDDSAGEYDQFSGMLVLDVDADVGFTELGRVDHGDMVRDSVCPWYGSDNEPCADDYWYASMHRSVVIDEDLFSISDYGVKATGHRDPDQVKAQVLFHPLGE